MKLATKFMLAMAFVGSLSLTSCKDIEEDDHAEIVATVGGELNACNKQIAEMQKRIEVLAEQIAQGGKCECPKLKMVKNADGSVTFSDKDGNTYTSFNPTTGISTGKDIATGEDYLIITYFDENGNIIGQSQPYAKVDPATLAKLKEMIGDVYGPSATYGTTGLVGKLNDLQNKYTELTGEVSTIKTDVATVKTDISTVKTDVATIKTDVSTVKTDISNMKTDISGIKTDVDGIKTDVSGIKTDVDGMKTDIDGMKTDIDGMKTDIDGMKTDIDGMKTDIDGMKTDITTIKTDINTIKSEVSTLKSEINTVNTKLTDLEERVSKLEDARKKLITGINIDQVWNPVFGSYNSVASNTKTSILMTYFGEATLACQFPSFDPQINIMSGETLISDAEDNAGKIYATINPVDQNFDKLFGLTLVNSQGTESSVKLGATKNSDAVLTSGWTAPTRAAAGFYEIPAYVSADDAKDDNKLHINIDKSKVKQAMSDLIKVRNASGAKIAAQELAGVAVDVVKAMRLEELKVKCAWTDELGEHAVYSQSDIVAVAAKPLGFKALDNVNFPYEKAVKAVNKIKKQIDEKVIARINKELAKYKEKIEQRGIINIKSGAEWGLDNCYVIKISYKGNADVKTSIEDINQKLIDAGQPALIVEADYDNKFIWVRYSIEDFRAAGDFIDGIAINDIANMTAMLDELLSRMDGKAEKIEGKIFDNIYKYLDKINNASNKAIHNILHPVLLVNSGKGLTVAAVEGAVPTQVSGNVVIIPTTYNGEIASPVFKKYIKINDNAGEIVETKSIDVTSKLVAGKNTIVFSALDYTGKEETVTYVIEK